MNLVQFFCAVVTRCLFILVSLLGVFVVVWVTKNSLYWLLTVLFLPQVAEMFLTLKRRKGKDYKWFSPAIFLFLISIIPSLWIIQLHHEENKSSDTSCNDLSSHDNIVGLLNQQRANGSEGVNPFSSVCANAWILGLHQMLLFLLILGKWLLPSDGELSRDQLSQLLLIFVGTASDILEFKSETLSDVKDNSLTVVYIVMAVWTWSMLQFPLHLSALWTPSGDQSEAGGSPVFSRLRNDLWSILEALFIQDGPFLVVRLTVMVYFKVVHQMLIFYTFKNLLVVTLNLYRLLILICDRRSS